MVSGAITLRYAGGCSFKDCTIHLVGEYAVRFDAGCRGNRIEKCAFTSAGAGGIVLCGDIEDKSFASRTSHNSVTGCEISYCGRVYLSAVGILIIHSAYNEVRNNHIHHLEYSGISCGWVWGFGENPTHHNRIEYNHIHHIGSGLLNDMGGIYTLGEQPSTVLRGNHIHDIHSHNYGGWAIYCDEGSSYIVVEDNLCYRTSSEVFNLHYGRENIIRNNIFALSELGILAISAAEEGRNAMTVERNIFYSQGKPVFVARDLDSLRQHAFISDLNLLWDTEGDVYAGDECRDDQANVTWKTYDMKTLQGFGYDRHSLVGDPGFTNPENGDFSVKNGRLLEELGIRLLKDKLR